MEIQNSSNVLLELLSAGVIAAFVTGVFSLVIAIKNNKRLTQLEKRRQQFTLDQERYKTIRDAYEELCMLLPDEKLLSHFMINLPSKKNFQENGLAEGFEIADENMKIMYSHFQKYSYLFSEDEQQLINSLIQGIDNIVKDIINLNTEMNIYNMEKEYENSDDGIYSKIKERIIKTIEFEEIYYNMFKNNLNKLSKTLND